MIISSLSNTFLLNHIFKFIFSYIVRYPSPKNIGYVWNFGSLSALFLIIQLFSGIILSMFYTAHIDLAFDSVDIFMNNIPYGWFVRYVHLNGATFMFICVYIHMFSGIYYSSYNHPSVQLWSSGILIYLILMATAFLGYVLPWGQMSFWAATVITNFLTIIPFIGDNVLCWVWGGYSINNATLNRFFSLHFILPFILSLLALVHLVLLHETSSSTDINIQISIFNNINFFHYYIINDLLTVWIFLLGFIVCIVFSPEYFNHSINYIQANFLVTPKHIVPEWYFLPFYAILSCIPNKVIGILMMLFSILIFFVLPFLDGTRFFNVFSIFNNQLFWVFVLNFIFLGFLGSQAMTDPCSQLGLSCTVVHFLYILVIPIWNKSCQSY